MFTPVKIDESLRYLLRFSARVVLEVGTPHLSAMMHRMKKGDRLRLDVGGQNPATIASWIQFFFSRTSIIHLHPYLCLSPCTLRDLVTEKMEPYPEIKKVYEEIFLEEKAQWDSTQEVASSLWSVQDGHRFRFQRVYRPSKVKELENLRKENQRLRSENEDLRQQLSGLKRKTPEKPLFVWNSDCVRNLPSKKARV